MVSKQRYTNVMVRPRTSTDDEIVERISSFLAQRTWPTAAWTLAEVAPSAGLSPAGIVKRFGSRAGLLRALGAHWLAALPQAPRGDVQPERELREYARNLFGAPTSVMALAGVRELLADTTDEAALRMLRLGESAQRRYVSALLQSMELARVADPEVSARTLLNALYGALLSRALGDSAESTSPDHIINYFLELWT